MAHGDDPVHDAVCRIADALTDADDDLVEACDVLLGHFHLEPTIPPRTLTVVIEQRADGVCMVSTTGNTNGDWERRVIPRPALALALAELTSGTRSEADAPLPTWVR